MNRIISIIKQSMLNCIMKIILILFSMMALSCNVLNIEEYNSKKYGEDWEVQFSENISVNLENMNGYIFDGKDKLYIFTTDKQIFQINTNTIFNCKYL